MSPREFSLLGVFLCLSTSLSVHLLMVMSLCAPLDVYVLEPLGIRGFFSSKRSFSAGPQPPHSLGHSFSFLARYTPSGRMFGQPPLDSHFFGIARQVRAQAFDPSPDNAVPLQHLQGEVARHIDGSFLDLPLILDPIDAAELVYLADFLIWIPASPVYTLV